MNTKFHVGQRVIGEQGQVVIVLDPKHDASIFKGVLVDAPIENRPIGYISSGWLKDSFVDFPIDPPRVVLTEWQEKELRKLLQPIADKIDGDVDAAIGRINKILSEPEPPKYQPKQGEAVLVKVNKEYPWIAAVFSNMEYEAYKCYGGMYAANYCIPFDPEKVGKITND